MFNNSNNSTLNKQELFRKLSELSTNDLKRINISENELNYLKSRVSNDKLGLVLNFEEKDEVLENNYFGLEEVKELHINPKEKNNNLLIEGDNYYALKALSISGIKVDVIYIDPPYNTGNKDFIYNDSFVNKDDEFKHSKWLSFMKKRLELAKELLADDGIIFVSIDDNEQAYLKVLMDEIFGEDNFISCLIWQKTTAPKNNSKYISINHDYILFYSKNKNEIKINLDKRSEQQLKDYKNPDDDPRGLWTRIKLRAPSYTKENDYEIEFNGKIYKQPDGFSWIVSKEKMEELIREKRVYSEGNMLRKKAFLLESKNGVTPISLLFKDKCGISQNGTEEFRLILMNNDFSYPKPVKLIKYLINLFPLNENKEISVLDFFAGSGTTAQAVMELNQEDGNNRRFILCTNNENDIATKICRERIYRVINGIGSNNEKIEWEYSKTKKSLTNNFFKYLRIFNIDKYNGNYEEINKLKNIYKNEFDKDLNIKDFK